MPPRWMIPCLLSISAGCQVRTFPSESPDAAEVLDQARCGVIKSADKPLVVEWPAAERAALESRAGQGLVAVRYEGCEMEVLPQCTVPGDYAYVGLTTKRESVRIRNVDELYARLPVGAASLEAQLQRTGQLNVDLTVVGRKEASAFEVSRYDLTGSCERATHFVSGLTVGAFSLYTGEGVGGGGGATVAGVGVGGGREVVRETLREDGDPQACEGASSGDQAPPGGCTALLRVEVLPLSEHRVASAPVVEDPKPEPLEPIDPSNIEPEPAPELEPEPKPEPAKPATVCDAIELEVVKVRRKRADPPFRDKAMDAVHLRIHNLNEQAINLQGGRHASFMDAERAVLDAQTPFEWHSSLGLPALSSKVVEVLLPRHAGPKLSSIEVGASPLSDPHDRCRVIDADLSAPIKADAAAAEPG